MYQTLLKFDDETKERKLRLIRKPTWEELVMRGLESFEKEQAGFNLEESGK